MEGGVGALTVKLNCWELLPSALVALTVGVKTPAALGVPLIVPVEEPREGCRNCPVRHRGLQDLRSFEERVKDAFWIG